MTNIICRTDYKLALNNRDRNRIFNNKDKKYVDKLLDYFSDDKKRVMNMLDYFTGKINKHDECNLVLENGMYATNIELQKRKKYINKQFNNSNIWQVVLSFDKKYLEKNINYRDLELKLAKEILPRFFKKLGFEDITKMRYQFSFHMNTKNPHFHISFMEKSPNYKNKRNELVYKKQGKIPNEIINYLKRETELCIERDKRFNPLATNINKDIEEFKKYFDNTKNYVLYDKNNILLEDKILRLGELLYSRVESTNNRIKYNSINDKEIKELTREIKNELFNGKLKYLKDSFDKSIDNMNDYLLKLNKDNNISIKDIDLKYTENKEKYLDNYVLNAIVNNLRTNSKKKAISKNNVLESVILKVFNNNKYMTKRHIVRNSFNNKYVLQNEIDSAIRNINNEIDKAVEEFYKSEYIKTL